MKSFKFFNTIFILIFSQSVIAQSYLYIDVKPTRDQIILMENAETLLEKNMDNIEVFSDPTFQLSTKQAELILQTKRITLKSPSFRIYIHPTNTYDTLTILGFSRNYFNKKSEKENDTTLQQLSLIPLIIFENILPEKTYNQLITTLVDLVSVYYENHDTSTYFKSVSFKINNESNILASSFYLFTCPEVYLYQNPYNKDSKLGLSSTHEFIDQDGMLLYEKFPLPQEILFSINFKVKHDTIPRPNLHYNYHNFSNLKLIINYEHIGLKYTVNRTTKTFWAEKDDIFNYLKEYKIFQVGMEFYLMSAIFKSLNVP